MARMVKWQDCLKQNNISQLNVIDCSKAHIPQKKTGLR